VRVNKAKPVVLDDRLLTAFEKCLAQRDVAAATVRSYRNDLSLFQRWSQDLNGQATVTVDRIQTVDLAAFRQHLIQEQSLRPATVNRRIQCFRTFFAWLRSQGVVPENPALSLRFVRSTARRKPVALQQKEVLALLRAAAHSGHGTALRNLALCQLLLQTGMRLGEVVALKVKDLDLRDRSGAVRIREGKGLKEREVPLNLTARRALSDYLNARGSAELEDWVFESKRKAPLSARGVQKVIHDLAAKAGITRIRVSAHTLRHYADPRTMPTGIAPRRCSGAFCFLYAA
jgi:site-specific recombinase XerD